MRLSIIGGLVILTAAVTAVTLRASDFVGVYTIVDKIVVEPSEAAPQRIQIWGAFALSDGKPGGGYGAAERGYVYYTCPPGQEAVCRKEWEDLKTVAGKDIGVGFGERYKATGRIRKAGETPASPDLYPIARGVVRLSAGHESLPVIERVKAAPRER